VNVMTSPMNKHGNLHELLIISCPITGNVERQGVERNRIKPEELKVKTGKGRQEEITNVAADFYSRRSYFIAKKCNSLLNL
jgi:hypothetical protein